MLFRSVKGMGLVNEVFNPDQLATKIGNAIIGHVRYSTTGSSVLANAQPLFAQSVLGAIALAHNGNLVNAHSLDVSLSLMVRFSKLVVIRK